MSKLSDSIPYNVAGFANNDGIVFSSINANFQGTVLQPISNPISAFVFSNPIQTEIPKPFGTQVHSSNFNQAVDFNANYLQPINLPVSQSQKNPVKLQTTYSPSGFTFAPLLAPVSLPIIPQDSTQQTVNLTTQQNNHFNNEAPLQRPKPSPVTLPSVDHESTDPVSMLKPSNKCGITKYTNSRVVGGSITQIGMGTIAFIRKVKQ